MSIDYDRLRAELDRHENGDDHDNYKADEWLYMNKGKTARELLRLHDGIVDERDRCARIATVCRSSNDPDAPAVASTLESVANSLNRLLTGDTE